MIAAKHLRSVIAEPMRHIRPIVSECDDGLSLYFVTQVLSFVELAIV
jgi:hypothetical protein